MGVHVGRSYRMPVLKQVKLLLPERMLSRVKTRMCLLPSSRGSGLGPDADGAGARLFGPLQHWCQGSESLASSESGLTVNPAEVFLQLSGS